MSPAKLRKRTPYGQLSRAGQSSEPSPTAVRRLRDAALAGMRSPEWATELGRLYLADKLTARQYQAGKAFAELLHDYRAALNTPPEAPSISIGEKVSRGHSDGAREARRHRRAVQQHDAALAAVRASVPVAEAILVMVCERDTVIVGEALRQLQSALTVLADHWGLRA